MTIGERIRAERIRQNLTAKELATKIGKSRNAVLEMEKGRATGQWETLNELCDALNVSADYILGRTERKTTKENS